jgi:hypothetical protein
MRGVVDRYIAPKAPWQVREDCCVRNEALLPLLFDLPIPGQQNNGVRLLHLVGASWSPSLTLLNAEEHPKRTLPTAN